MDRFCDYHQEKGHHTNDYHHLWKQLEAALESGKLNHLIRDVRQRGRGSQKGDGSQQAKIINMVEVSSTKEKKRKERKATERDVQKNDCEVHCHQSSLALQCDIRKNGAQSPKGHSFCNTPKLGRSGIRVFGACYFSDQ
ncbi:hypothetical protein Tco_0027384 [Tanacetum coccineum]